MTATIMATGAFHEDALADSVDGFGGGRTPERVMEIMKDSRVGAYALVGVVLVLGIKFATLLSIATSPGNAIRALSAGHVLARWSSIPLMMKYSYVRPPTTNPRPSAGGPFADGLGRPRATFATIIAAASLITALGLGSALVTAIVAALVTILAGLWFKRRIGGVTGDTLGAANQVVEVSVYLALSALR